MLINSLACRVSPFETPSRNGLFSLAARRELKAPPTQKLVRPVRTQPVQRHPSAAHESTTSFVPAPTPASNARRMERTHTPSHQVGRFSSSSSSFFFFLLLLLLLLLLFLLLLLLLLVLLLLLLLGGGDMPFFLLLFLAAKRQVVTWGFFVLLVLPATRPPPHPHNTHACM